MFSMSDKFFEAKEKISAAKRFTLIFEREVSELKFLHWFNFNRALKLAEVTSCSCLYNSLVN